MKIEFDGVNYIIVDDKFEKETDSGNFIVLFPKEIKSLYEKLGKLLKSKKYKTLLIKV